MFFFFKQKTAYDRRISDWSSDVCSSDLRREPAVAPPPVVRAASTTAPTPVELDAAGWPDFVAALDLRGPVKELAASAGFVAWSDGVLRLSLPPADDHLKAPFLVSQLASALAVPFGAQPQIRDRKSTRLNSSHSCATRM